jgi:hypothetical protein
MNTVALDNSELFWISFLPLWNLRRVKVVGENIDKEFWNGDTK